MTRRFARYFKTLASTALSHNLSWPLIVLAVALLWRLIVLASNTVTFHSDEAVVGLMARHINQGLPIPTFFYGQPYMGSLDALLVAGMFRIAGSSVLSIHLVQLILYLGMVATFMALTFRLTGDRWTTIVAGLLMALPPLLITLYTTISLGGYGETMLFGNLLLLVGYDLSTNPDLGSRNLWSRWLALGALFGLGWWTDTLIVVYALPVVIFLLIRWRHLRWSMIIVAGLAALLFSLPWWVYNVQNNWESVRFVLGGFPTLPNAPQASIGDRLFNFLVIGLPALAGTRYPWTLPFVIPTVVVGLIYLSILTAPRLVPVGKPLVMRFLLTMLISGSAINIMSSFGADPTSRYLMPLAIPLVSLVTINLNALRQHYRWSSIAVPIMIGAQLLVTIGAMRTLPPGITPQWYPPADIPPGYDQQVIDFLTAHQVTAGYSTYWAAYRLTFLSGERVILTPELPWRTSLYYVQADERYLPYKQIVDQTDRPALVTANLPMLDQKISERLDSAGIGYKKQCIGPYSIFYDLSRHITPSELGLQSLYQAGSAY